MGRIALRRTALRTIAGLAITYGLYAVFLTALQRRLLFPRDMTAPDPRAGAEVDGLDRWTLDTSDGPVEGWFLPGDGVTRDRPGPAVMFAHGNAELIDDWPHAMAPYRRLGVSVLLAEYRGYGRSAGAPSEAAIAADFVAFYDRLRARPEVDPARVFLHGRSLGGGAACAVAAQRPAAALILQSTFTSVADMAKRFGLPGFFVRDRFDNHRVIRDFDGPILLIHGRRDEVIPFEHAKRNRAAARNVVFRDYDAGHNDCPPRDADLWRDVEVFLTDAAIIR